MGEGWIAGEKDPLTRISPAMEDVLKSRFGQTEEDWEEYKRKRKEGKIAEVETRIAEKLEKAIIGPVTEDAKFVLEALSEDQQRIAESVFDEKPGLSSWQEIMFTVETGAISLGEAVAITIITKSPSAGAAFLSALEASDEYNKARDAGLSPEKALETAIASGVGTFFLEKAGLDFLFAASAGNRIWHAVKIAGLESWEDELETVWQHLEGKYAYDESQALW